MKTAKNKVIVEADSVSFRCATSLKEQVREAGLELVKKTGSQKATQEQRLQNILAQVKEQMSINSTTCMQINRCSRFMALNDLKLLSDSNKLMQIGSGKQIMYILPYK